MQPNNRFHALDAVRAYALLLGIFLHAATPWLKDVDVWPIREQPADALAVVWFVIHMFRMQVFFLIAGFFGSMVLQRRGMQGFIKDRAKRIVLPFVIGLPTVMILMSLMYVAGFLLSGHTLSDLMTTVQQQSQDAQKTPRQGGPNAGPLWFLYYLIIYYAAVLFLHMIVKIVDRNGMLMRAADAIVKFLMSGVWGPIFLGLSFALYFYHQLVWSAWTGVSGPRSFVPNASLLAYGLIFGLGWLLHRQKDLLLNLEKTWQFYCALAVVLTVTSLWIGGTTPHWKPYMQGDQLMHYSIAYMVGMWCWVFGLIGAALRFLSNESTVRRYLADSSYWMYLLHVPLLLFVHSLLQATEWHWSIEYVLSIIFVTPILLLTYHYCVRSTFIGATLNGRRYPKTLSQPVATVTSG